MWGVCATGSGRSVEVGQVSNLPLRLSWHVPCVVGTRCASADLPDDGDTYEGAHAVGHGCGGATRQKHPEGAPPDALAGEA